MKKSKIVIVLLILIGIISLAAILILANTKNQTIETLGMNHCTSDENSEQWKDCETNNASSSKFIINDEVIELSCNHEFHEECIKIYLKEYNCKCPLCRIDIEENNHKYNL